MGRRLTNDELRRCDSVLADADAERSLPRFMERTLEALDEHLGLTVSKFMLALSDGDWPGHRAYAGMGHGQPEYVMEEYFERWADVDALTTDAARLSYYRTGRAAIREFYGDLSGSSRDFVDSFLRRNGEAGMVSFRLAAGRTDAYLSPAAVEDEAPLSWLVPRLTELLRDRLPRGLDGDLSVREGQVAELVSLGCTNREIATVLHVEEDTVKKHVSRAMERIGVSRRTQLGVAWATGILLTVP